MAALETTQYKSRFTSEMISVDLQQTPAFCFQFPDITRVTMWEFLDQTKALRQAGIICNPAHPFIVGFVRNPTQMQLLHNLQKNTQGLLGIGTPMEGGSSELVINKKNQELDLGCPALIASVRLVQTMGQNHEIGVAYGRLDPRATPQQRGGIYKKSPIIHISRAEATALTKNLGRLPHERRIKQYLKRKLAVFNHSEEHPITIIEHDLQGSTEIVQSPQWPEVHLALVAYFNKLRDELEQADSGNILTEFRPFDLPLTESMNIWYFHLAGDDEAKQRMKLVDEKIKISDDFLQDTLQQIQGNSLALNFITKPPKLYQPKQEKRMIVQANPFDFTPLTLPRYMTEEQLQSEETAPQNDIRRRLREAS